MPGGAAVSAVAATPAVAVRRCARARSRARVCPRASERGLRARERERWRWRARGWWFSPRVCVEAVAHAAPAGGVVQLCASVRVRAHVRVGGEELHLCVVQDVADLDRRRLWQVAEAHAGQHTVSARPSAKEWCGHALEACMRGEAHAPLLRLSWPRAPNPPRLPPSPTRMPQACMHGLRVGSNHTPVEATQWSHRGRRGCG